MKKRMNTVCQRPGSRKTIPPNIKDIHDYINIHFKEKIVMPDLEERSTLSRTELMKSFLIYYGCTPKEYLDRRRILEAKTLLESTNMSLLEIADKAGFCSASYFSQAFKRHIGMSPLKYRKKTKKKTETPIEENRQMELSDYLIG